MLTETDYRRACAELFSRVEDKLDAAGVDYDGGGEMMEITAGDGKIIINLQPPLKQIWLAAKSGGYHFELQNGDWRDTRDGVLFFERLEKLLA